MFCAKHVFGQFRTCFAKPKFVQIHCILFDWKGSVKLIGTEFDLTVGACIPCPPPPRRREPAASSQLRRWPKVYSSINSWTIPQKWPTRGTDRGKTMGGRRNRKKRSVPTHSSIRRQTKARLRKVQVRKRGDMRAAAQFLALPRTARARQFADLELTC